MCGGGVRQEQDGWAIRRKDWAEKEKGEGICKKTVWKERRSDRRGGGKSWEGNLKTRVPTEGLSCHESALTGEGT